MEIFRCPNRCNVKMRKGQNLSMVAILVGIIAFLGAIFFVNHSKTNPQSLEASSLQSNSQNSEGDAKKKQNVSPLNKTFPKEMILGVLRGNATLIRENVEYKIQKTDPAITIVVNDRIILKEKETCLFKFVDGRMVKFSGEGEYRPQLNDIKIIRGGMVLTFSSSPKGYKINLPTSILGIRGTTIHLKIASDSDQIWVSQGIVDWQHKYLEKSGVIIPGEGLKITRSGVEVIEASPLGISDEPVFEHDDHKLEPPLASYPLALPSDSTGDLLPGVIATETPFQPTEGSGANKIINPFEEIDHGQDN